ncbi:hypothetical protein ABPG75_006548 [Micractinium tetrahymenae]
MGAAEPLTVYAARAKDIQTQLSSAGDAASDQDTALQFLAGLPPAYGMISMVLTAGDQQLKIDSMLPKLLQTEQQMLQEPSERPTETALSAKPSGGFGRARNNGSDSIGSRSNNGSGNSSRKTCFYCGRQGHIKSDCFKRKRDMERGSAAGAHVHHFSTIAL